MKDEIILIGGGGHCKACIDVIEAEGKFEIKGIVDAKEKLNQRVLDYKIIGCDGDLPQLSKKYKYFLISIGQIKSAEKRKDKFSCLKNLGAKLPLIISPSAHISKHAEAGEGTIVMHNAFINAGVKIGEGCIINTNAIIEHNSNIGNHCHISLGSIIASDVDIGQGVFVGSNSVIINGLKVADGVVIGAGSVVTGSITETGTYAGNPAKKIK